MLTALLFVLPFFTGSFTGATPLEWRSFSTSLTSHHTLILWGMAILLAALMKTGVKPLLAVGAVFMLLSTHELFWWAFDVVNTSQVMGQTFHWYWLFGYLLPPCLGCFMIYPSLTGHFPRRLIMGTFFFDVAWALAGWPVTVNYVGGIWPKDTFVTLSGHYFFVPVTVLQDVQGLTKWFGTPWGDGWEFASWAVLFAVFWFLERRELLRCQRALG